MALSLPTSYLPLCPTLLEGKTSGKPDRLARRLKLSEDTIARLQITERIWSRTTDRFYRKVENQLSGVVKISEAKSILRNWIKSNIPLCEEN